MSTEATITEADILAEVVAPNHPWSPELAKELLSLKFDDKATAYMRELLQKNNAGTITPAEQSTLRNYLRVGQFLDLMQAGARLTLQAA